MNATVVAGFDPACDAFVRKQVSAKICHLQAWGEMVSRALGHKAFYLAATEGGVVQGVLPLVQVRSCLFGNRLVSQAFSNYGGPLTGNPTAREALYERAVELADELGCKTVEFRNTDPLPYELHERNDKVAMHLPLRPDPEKLWTSFNPKVRNQVRKAEKSDVVPECGGLELLDDFYRVWTIRMWQLGTPCYPRRLFRSIYDTFPDACRIFIVRFGERPVGVAFVNFFNKLAEIRWAATLVEYNTLCPNNLLYWSVMKHYCVAGASCFDFGRSTIDGPQYRFKKQWGAQRVNLHYQYWVRPGHELSVATPDSPQYARKVKIWKRLPLWTTRLLGPLVSRSLP